MKPMSEPPESHAKSQYLEVPYWGTYFNKWPEPSLEGSVFFCADIIYLIDLT